MAARLGRPAARIPADVADADAAAVADALAASYGGRRPGTDGQADL
ncbi:hypothetical protein [Streptomyces sp. C]|nr:hypothetical protein [Streptomyces sp. C]